MNNNKIVVPEESRLYLSPNTYMILDRESLPNEMKESIGKTYLNNTGIFGEDPIYEKKSKSHLQNEIDKDSQDPKNTEKGL